MTKKFSLLKNPSSWRRLSIANWKAPNDPTVYGSMSFDWTKGALFLDKLNAQSDIKIPPTHFMAKTVALVLKKYPDLNGVIRWNKIYLRNTVDIFLQVAIDDEKSGGRPDLSGAKIDECDIKNLSQIALELKKKSESIRQKNDPQFKKTLNLIKIIPPFLLPWVIRMITFLIHDLRINRPSLGLVADPFGSAMVTSVGMLKVPPGYAPLVPISRVPLIICIGEILDKPWVVNKEVVVRPVLKVMITFDHRFMDGLKGSQMAHLLTDIISNPEKFML